MRKKYTLHEAREKAGFTVENSAVAIGTTKDEIIEAENKPSEVSIHTAVRLSNLYRIPISMIMWNIVTI